MVTARRSHNNYACTAVIRATGVGHCYERVMEMYVSACVGLALMVDTGHAHYQLGRRQKSFLAFPLLFAIKNIKESH